MSARRRDARIALAVAALAAAAPLAAGSTPTARHAPATAPGTAPLIIYVDDDAAPGGDGSSWPAAYTDLQDALLGAPDLTFVEIRVAGGVYRPDRRAGEVSDDREATFRMRNQVSILGGFAGIGAADPDERDPALHETVLSGAIGAPDDDEDNSGHVVTAEDVNGSAALDGLTVAGGNTIGFYPDDSGGGVIVRSGAPVFRACLFRDNTCYANTTGTFGGGGAAVLTGRPLFTDCTFRDNYSRPGGGGLHSIGDPTLVACRFENNTTSSSTFGPGGGVHAEAGSIRLVDCVFTGNFGDGDGGGLGARNTTVIAIGCDFHDNVGDSGGGGADVGSGNGEVFFLGCTFTENDGTSSGFAVGGGLAVAAPGIVANCLFRANASDGAGALSISADTLVTHLAFLGNDANREGGAIKMFGGHLRIVNCLFSGNSAGDLGGAVRASGDLELLNCTIAGNAAGDGADGVLVAYEATTITNCILWGNGDGTEAAQLVVDNLGTVTVDHTCLQGLTGAYGGVGNIGDDPMFVDLAGIDGFIGTEDDDARLQPLSPCIDAGATGAVDACILDLDAAHRAVDDPAVPDSGSGGPPVVDLGAYEAGADPGEDCDGDGLDDGCAAGSLAPDCNVNGVPDLCDLSGGASPDCNANLTPDECDLLVGSSLDCDGNLVPDECDIASGLAADCNGNGVPDACDVDGGPSFDCNDNAIPDECETDCNGNGIPDDCDIESGESTDADGNGVPDECEAVINVDQDIGYATVALALEGANDGDELIVAPGLHVGTFSFLGKAVALRSAEGPAMTILDGGGDGPVIRCESGEGPDTVLEGFTVTGGVAVNGGGMLNSGSSPTVTGCRFVGNVAQADPYQGYGGGMYNAAGSAPVVTGCLFAGNQAHSGGGMYSVESSPTVIDCDFIANAAVVLENGPGTGGGMAIVDSSATITDCLFEDGFSAVRGGAIYAFESAAVVSDCVFRDNASGGDGGAVYDDAGSPAYLVGAYLRCRFSGNSAGVDGGAILLDDSPAALEIVSCLLDGNTAARGGGVHLDFGASPTILGCTIVGNAATSESGGALYNSGGRPVLRSCIVRDNGPDAIGVGESSDPPIIVYGNVEGGWDAVGNVDVDPLFVDAAAGDYRLAAGSPCVDAGDPLLAGMPDGPDLDGGPRVIACRMDIGAYESAEPGPDCDANGVPDGCDLLAGAADCDGNGVPDACDISLQPERDCDGNGVLDECELADTFVSRSPHLAPFVEDESPQQWVIPAPPVALDDVTLDLTMIADQQGGQRSVIVDLNGVFLDRVLNSGQSVCRLEPVFEQIVLTAETFNDLVAGGDAVLDFRVSTFGSPAADCANTFIGVEVRYAVEPAPDCNANARLDACDIADGTSVDFDQNGVPDECDPDCNGNGLPDFIDVAFGLSLDCNDNGVPDECDLDSGASPDCNDNGIPDECDVAAGTVPDCNGNGVPDECDVASGASFDLNANSIPDECEPDCNDNGIPDFLDLVFGVSLDCNDNEVPDECDIDGGLAADCNDNGAPDACDIADGTEADANGNGIPDSCERPADLDGDGDIAFADLITLLAAWGTCPPADCPGDLDDNGAVDFADLLALIAAWGTCP